MQIQRVPAHCSVRLCLGCIYTVIRVAVSADICKPELVNIVFDVYKERIHQPRGTSSLPDSAAVHPQWFLHRKLILGAITPSCPLRHMQCDSCSRSQMHGGIPAQLNYAVRSRSATLRSPIINRGETDRHKFTGVLALRTTGNDYRGILGMMNDKQLMLLMLLSASYYGNLYPIGPTKHMLP